MSAVSFRPLRRMLVVSNTDAYVAVHMRDFLRRLSTSGVEIHALTPRGDFLADLADEGIRWRPLRLARGRRGVWTSPWAIAGIRKGLTDLRPDLLLNVTALPVLLGTLAAQLTSLPAVINVFPGLGHLFARAQRGRFVERALLIRGYRWVASRRRAAAIFQLKADQARVLGVQPSPRWTSRIIPGWGVDVRRFSLARDEASPPRVALVGRQLWEKGVGDFVEAARRLRRVGRKAQFILVGTPDVGNPGSIPTQQLHRWNEEGVVEWWGWRRDIPAIMAEAALLVHPTRYGEGVPRVLVEAGAAGLAVVASDVPGCRRIVRDEVNGWIVPTGDVDTLTSVIGRALDDPTARTALGEAARRIVLGGFTVDTVVDHYLEVFRSMGLELPRPGSVG